MQTRIFKTDFLAAVAAGVMAMLAMAGCDRQIAVHPVVLEGQVFLVQPGGGSLRLGSVEVSVFDEAAALSHLAAKELEIEARRKEAIGSVAGAEETLAQQREKQITAEMAFRRRESAVRQEMQDLMARTRERLERLDRTVADNENFIANMHQAPSPPLGIPSRADYEAFARRRAQWFSMGPAERESWANALSEMNARLVVEIDQITDERDYKVAAWGKELEELERAVEQARAATSRAAQAIFTARDALAAIPSLSDYLRQFPEPLSRVRTDADGEFRVTVPAARRYAVFAQTLNPGNADEIISWFIWVAAPDSAAPAKILLSNHNVVTSRAAENIVLFLAAREEPNVPAAGDANG